MKTRSKITILGCLSLAAAALVSGATGGAEAGSNATSAVPGLVKCSGLPELPSARCGSIRVPLDRANPTLGTIRIAFTLVPRRNSAKRALATIVISGDGASRAAVPYAQGLAPLLAGRDLLLIDQRGTGRSSAIVCRTLRGVSVGVTSRTQLLARIGACGRELGPRAGAYGTAAAADDIEAVRAALALDRLDLWGSSYSTYLMTVYAAHHPAHVRSLVLQGAYPIDFDPWALDRLAGARRAIGLVCARTRACRGEAVLRDVARLSTQLRRHPVSFAVSDGPRRSRLRLDEAALATLVYASSGPAAYGRIPAAVASALDGDSAPLRRLVAASVTPFAPSFAQAFAQQCHEYPRVFSYSDPPAVRRAAFVRARGEIAPRRFWPFSPAAWTATQLEAVDSCLQWPNDQTAAPPFPPGTRLPDVPALVVSGDLDTNTPTSAGRQAARQYPRASFVEIPNVGHTPESSPCGVALGLRFIATLKVNPRACVGTGAPPPVAARAPRLAAELRLVPGEGTRAERRALALVVATAADLAEQAPIVAAAGAADGLRGGRYVAAKKGAIRLDGVRIVRDASVSGVLSSAEGQTTGTLRLNGSGVPAGRLRVRLASGRGRATGLLDGRHVDLAFRF